MKPARMIWLIALLFLVAFGWTGFCEENSGSQTEAITENSMTEDEQGWDYPQMGPPDFNDTLERIKKIDPEAAERFAKLRKEDPQTFGKELWVFMSKHGREMYPEMKHFRGPMAGPPMGPHRGVSRFGGGSEWHNKMQQKHDDYIEWLQENYPEKATELEEIREDNPPLYMRKLMHSMRKYGRIAELSKDNPELAKVLKENEELKDQRDEILKKLGSADGKEKEQLQAELKNIVSRRFDLIVKRKELQHKKLLDKLEDLKKQIQASQDDVEKWKASKTEKVEARLKELLKPTEEFHWD
jgi:hypothetical protein